MGDKDELLHLVDKVSDYSLEDFHSLLQEPSLTKEQRSIVKGIFNTMLSDGIDEVLKEEKFVI